MKKNRLKKAGILAGGITTIAVINWGYQKVSEAAIEYWTDKFMEAE